MIEGLSWWLYLLQFYLAGRLKSISGHLESLKLSIPGLQRRGASYLSNNKWTQETLFFIVPIVEL